MRRRKLQDGRTHLANLLNITSSNSSDSIVRKLDGDQGVVLPRRARFQGPQTLVSRSLRLKDLPAPVPRVTKKKKTPRKALRGGISKSILDRFVIFRRLFPSKWLQNRPLGYPPEGPFVVTAKPASRGRVWNPDPIPGPDLSEYNSQVRHLGCEVWG